MIAKIPPQFMPKGSAFGLGAPTVYMRERPMRPVEEQRTVFVVDLKTLPLAPAVPAQGQTRTRGPRGRFASSRNATPAVAAMA